MIETKDTDRKRQVHRDHYNEIRETIVECHEMIEALTAGTHAGDFAAAVKHEEHIIVVLEKVIDQFYPDQKRGVQGAPADSGKRPDELDASNDD
jgi:hypothetical protein